MQLNYQQDVRMQYDSLLLSTLVTNEIPNRSLGRSRFNSTVCCSSGLCGFIVCIHVICYCVCSFCLFCLLFTLQWEICCFVFIVLERFLLYLIQGAKWKVPLFFWGSDLFAPLWGCELPHLRRCPRPFSDQSIWAFFSKSGCLNLISCPLPYKWHFWWGCDYEFSLSRGSPWMDRCKWPLSSEARWPLGRGPAHPWQLPLVKFFADFGPCAVIRRWGLWTLIKS